MAKLVKTSDLTPHPCLGGDTFLPPLSDDEYQGLLDSIREVGIMQPIVVAWPDKVILDGHHRWRAAQEVGLEEVPVMTEEFLDEAGQLQLGLALNLDRRQVSTGQKGQVVEALLLLDPEQSNRAIAGVAGVSHPSVAKVRFRLETEGRVEKVSTRTGRDGVRQRVTGHSSGTRTRKRRRSKADHLVAYITDLSGPPRISAKALTAVVRQVARTTETEWRGRVIRVHAFLGAVIDALASDSPEAKDG